jgi:hypothetical protein
MWCWSKPWSAGRFTFIPVDKTSFTGFQVEGIQLETCFHCGGPLIEIDHYGERLVGCIECNRWTWSRSGQLMIELPKEDLEALSL